MPITTVTSVNDAPTFTSTPVTTADVDSPVTALTIAALVQPGWLTLADNGHGTATLSGTPTLADIGDHSVELRVSDGTAATTQSFVITVSEGMYTISSAYYLAYLWRLGQHVP